MSPPFPPRSTNDYWDHSAGKKHFGDNDGTWRATPSGRVLNWPEADDAAAVRSRQPTAFYKSLRERQNQPVPTMDEASRATIEEVNAQRAAYASKFGAIARTPPGRVIGWQPN